MSGCGGGYLVLALRATDAVCGLCVNFFGSLNFIRLDNRMIFTWRTFENFVSAETRVLSIDLDTNDLPATKYRLTVILDTRSPRALQIKLT